MRTAVVGLRAGILLVVLSSWGTAGYAQPAAQAAEQARAPAGCHLAEAGCPPELTPPADNTARAQEVPSSLGDALRTIGQDFASFPSATTFTWLGAGAGFALVGTAGDRAVSIDGKRLRGFGAGARMGGLEANLGLAFGTFMAGRLSHSKEVSALGFQLIRANLMTQAITHGIKFATQRVRPDGTQLSFPSGHTSTSFAAATVLQRRYGWKAGVPAYVAAAYIGASRVNDRRHYASDVIFGASLGIAVGLTVTRGNHRVASFIPAPVATHGGAAAVWTKTW